jgi:TonB-dependent starch-binding outer membrane protein SusC
MNRFSLSPRHLLLAAAMAASAALPCQLQARQAGAIVGVVMDGRTLDPLAGANISLREAALSAQTDEGGHFSLGEVGEGLVTVRVEFSGYSVAVEQVDITVDEISFVQFHLFPLDVMLDEVLVLGRRSERAVGSSESIVRGEYRGSSATAADLLAQRVPGLTVQSSSTPGGAGRIRIRGISSISLGAEPAIFINGVRVLASGGTPSSNAFQLLREIPASDVTRIRVLRGPAADAQVGGSSTGVILVETRSGPDPAPRDREP